MSSFCTRGGQCRAPVSAVGVSAAPSVIAGTSPGWLTSVPQVHPHCPTVLAVDLRVPVDKIRGTDSFSARGLHVLRGGEQRRC